MKYLKQFENAEQLKLSFVTVGNGDPVYVLYINDIMHSYGDNYHHKYCDWYRGFKDGLTYAKVSFIEDTIDIEEGKWVEELCELAGVPPNSISEL